MIVLLLGFILTGPQVQAVTTVGSHHLVISQRGEKTQFVSVPFLKLPVAQGRLDGVDAAAATLTDKEGAFSNLDVSSAYILRITSGPGVGSWFQLNAGLVSADSIAIRDDVMAGSLDMLEGDEAFQVHELFELGELLPETHKGLVAGPIDLLSTQVHVFEAGEFVKVWLSDGSITERPGWTYAAGDELRHIGHASVLPGTSFLIVQPNDEQDMSIRVSGVVLDDPISIPIGPGYNYVSVAYNTGMHRESGADYALEAIGLVESGFGSDGAADQVLHVDPRDGSIAQAYKYDSTTESFQTDGEPVLSAVTDSIEPGRGFIIYNSGDSYLWKYAH
ncbi:hypothetical protein [Coraliomargarita akajimensis]|uniref:hypothetical protein n=1 Tax=Coraliomargarita akajimensis TaxID=395922 RepID=UPI00145F5DC3|nr:hypothetical protein [Coraliomargarita akajimensis]